MNWNRYYKIALINVFMIPLLSVITLGTLGYLFAGQAGLKNGVAWGLILGLVSVPFSTLVLRKNKYWAQFFGKIGNWYGDEESDGEDKP